MEQLAAGLRERGHEVEVTEPSLVLRPVEGCRVDLKPTVDGWSLVVVGFEDLRYHSAWTEGPRGSADLVELHLRMISDLRQAADQGRVPADGPLSGSESPGSEGAGGEGAQGVAHAVGLLPGVITPLGIYVAIAGVIGFAVADEAGWLSSGYALAGAGVSLTVGWGLMIGGVLLATSRYSNVKRRGGAG